MERSFSTFDADSIYQKIDKICHMIADTAKVAKIHEIHLQQGSEQFDYKHVIKCIRLDLEYMYAFREHIRYLMNKKYNQKRIII